MSLFATTFYNSFSSAGKYPSSANKQKNSMMAPAGYFNDIETIKVTASRSQIDLFNTHVLKLRQDLNIKVKLTVLLPCEGAVNEQRGRRQDSLMQKMDSTDSGDSFLDRIFSDKIPLIHDLLMLGEPDVQILKVEGRPEMVDLFNTQIERMVFAEGLSVDVILVTRKKIHIQQVVSNSLDEVEDSLDFIFTDDFSKSMPIIHKLIMGSAY
jgi:hypothetical protein